MKLNQFVSTLTRGRKAFGQLCGALALAAAGMAQAAPVTYYFGGQLSSVDPNLSPTLAIGDGFSGSFTYESTTADSLPGDPSRGSYGPGPAFTVTINSLPFWIVGGGSGSVTVYNDYGGSDMLSVGAGDSATTAPYINGFSPIGFSIQLGDSTHSAFGSDALLSSELALAEFNWHYFELPFENPRFAGLAFAQGPLSYLSLTDPDAITSIPEPSSLALLGLGLAGLGASIKRNRSDCSQAASTDGYNVVAKILGAAPGRLTLLQKEHT